MSGNTGTQAQSNITPRNGNDGGSRMSWPSINAQNFAQLQVNAGEMQPVKMITMRLPDAYIATHNTMPSPRQVIRMVPTHDTLRELYQLTDRKMAGKRENAAAEPDATLGATRPAKTLRSS